MSTTYGMLEQLGALAASADGLEVEQLSEGQRIALCWLAGCEMLFEPVDRKPGLESLRTRLNVKTKNPVGIVKIDGQFRVYERRP